MKIIVMKIVGIKLKVKDDIEEILGKIMNFNVILFGYYCIFMDKVEMIFVEEICLVRIDI